MKRLPPRTLPHLRPLLEGLGDWRRHAIWVGNGVMAAYSTDPAVTRWHNAKEAAFLLQLPSVIDRYRWEELLKEKDWQRLGAVDNGFVRYQWKSHTALVASWPGEALIGRDRWYEEACFHAEHYALDEEQSLTLFSPIYVLATNLGALPPATADLRRSEAFARIVYLFAGRRELTDEIDRAYYEVRQFIRHSLQKLQARSDFEEALYAVLPPGEQLILPWLQEHMAACQDSIHTY